ncbi:3',5'-cyclic-AMP phosphodiesterase [Pseudomaricurvus sp. HS19]|nr:3',5'-cyclic-AMP phosphodiesterase [Pseudomaricurvus sp. HS19]MYM63379.1 3',5'-cyclic-AMP phosphodiesterase [Pseudomaricurvus sp. HS19]
MDLRPAPQRVLQISDSHLGGRPGETLLGLDTDESLQDVLQRLRQREQHADYVVATGDISSNGQMAAYERFLRSMESGYGRPLAWLAGNHDRDQSMCTFPRERVARELVELDHWQLILLNSSLPGHEHGLIGDQELQRLEQQLQGCDKHALVFVHHQPVLVGSRWIDQYVIRNAGALLGLLSRYPHVRALCWGHVHQDFSSRWGHFGLYSAPSTCIQFKPRCDDFALDTAMPGYRWFDLHANGELQTGVERTAEKSYAIDFASGGY